MVYGEISDGSLVLCHGRSDRAFVEGRASVRDRARQMNAGAACAGGDVRLPLHADTHLPAHAVGLVVHAPRRSAPWGRIDVRTAGSSSILPVIAAWMNWRACWAGIATGDQAMFVRRPVFKRLGGFLRQALMEDVGHSRRLRVPVAPACVQGRAVAAGRCWQARSVRRTVWPMWQPRWRHAYAMPADVPARGPG